MAETFWGTIVKNLNWTLILTIINFGLLVWVLKRLLYRRTLEWIERRRALEEERLQRAKKLEEEANALFQRRREELSEANRMAREILSRAEAEAQRILKEAREEARRQAQVILEEARVEAQREREEILAELKRQYADLVVLAASRVLAREVRREDHEALLSQMIQGIERRLLQ